MFHSFFLAHFKRQRWSLALRAGQRLSAQKSVLGVGWDCRRSGGSALPVFLLCICLNSLAAGGPVSQMGCSGLGSEVYPGHLDFFFFPFSVCLATCKRALKRGQCMDFMVKRNHWRAGHRFCLLLLLLSLFNYLCSKWMKQL